LRGRIDDEAERVAVAERPHVVPCPVVVQKRVIVRNGPVGIDSYDLAEIGAEILRRLETLPIAGRDEQLAGGREHQSPADVAAADRLRPLAPYHSYVLELQTIQLATRHHRALEHGIRQILELPEARIGVVAFYLRLLLGRLAVR